MYKRQLQPTALIHKTIVCQFNRSGSSSDTYSCQVTLQKLWKNILLKVNWFHNINYLEDSVVSLNFYSDNILQCKLYLNYLHTWYYFEMPREYGYWSRKVYKNSYPPFFLLEVFYIIIAISDTSVYKLNSFQNGVHIEKSFSL